MMTQNKHIFRHGGATPKCLHGSNPSLTSRSTTSPLPFLSIPLPSSIPRSIGPLDIGLKEHCKLPRSGAEPQQKANVVYLALQSDTSWHTHTSCHLICIVNERTVQLVLTCICTDSRYVCVLTTQHVSFLRYTDSLPSQLTWYQHRVTLFIYHRNATILTYIVDVDERSSFQLFMARSV